MLELSFTGRMSTVLDGASEEAICTLCPGRVNVCVLVEAMLPVTVLVKRRIQVKTHMEKKVHIILSWPKCCTVVSFHFISLINIRWKLNFLQHYLTEISTAALSFWAPCQQNKKKQTKKPHNFTMFFDENPGISWYSDISRGGASKGIYLIAALLAAALLSVPQAPIDTYQLFKGGDSPLSPINSTLRHALPRHYKSHYFYP